MGGDKTNRRKALFVVGGTAKRIPKSGSHFWDPNARQQVAGEPTTKEPVRSVGLAGREEAKPLGVPDKEESGGDNRRDSCARD